jgi:hypothetical protein
MAQLPSKIWLIQGQHPATRLQEVAYPTDPREYRLPGARPVTDEEYAAMADRVKVFQSADDAIEFCYACGFQFTMIHGFRLIDGQYIFDSAVTDEVLDSPW